jgi:hypothetical protein
MILPQPTIPGNAAAGTILVPMLLLLMAIGGLQSIPNLHAGPAPRKDPTPEEVNRAFGIPLFGSGSLWAEEDQAVAERLDWPRESRTSVESGYRLYCSEPLSVLGPRPFSLFLQGVGGKPSRVSMIFANKGDVEMLASKEEKGREVITSAQAARREAVVTPRMMQLYQAAIRHDEERIRGALTALFGEPMPAKLGKVVGMDERGERWDWRGSAFLLFAPRNEYVALRIMPVSVFNDLDAERRSFTATKALLPGRIVRRPNGDVILGDLPMVDQGAKGYCVPATFERVLRYYGLQADMDLLAMAGGTSAGGGTSLSRIADAAYGLVREAGGRITTAGAATRIEDIQPHIDRGVPLIWAINSSEELDQRLAERSRLRATFRDSGDVQRWKGDVLPPVRINARTLQGKGEGHVCLIIGYNRETREIAISDSWGPDYAERWMTEEEARSVGLGSSSVIGW